MRKLKLFSSVIAATILASSMIFSLPANVNAADKDINSTFPDEVFRNWVKENADKNNDGKLSQTEIASVKKLNIFNSGDSSNQIKNLTGLSLFTNLEYITLYNHSISSIRLSSFSSLKSVSCCKCGLTKLELTDMPVLDSINCSDNSLTKFNAKGCPKLEQLNCSNNKLKEGLDYFNISNSIDIKYINVSDNSFTKFVFGNNYTKIESFYGSNNPLKTVGFSGAKDLKHLDLSKTKISTFSVPNPKSLERLDVGDNANLTDTDFSKYTNLKYLYCNACKLKSLDISKLTELVTLVCEDNRDIKEINFSNCKKLKFIDATHTGITNPDLSNLSELQYLSCVGCKLENLDLRNNTELVDLYCYNNSLTSLDLSSNKILNTVECDNNDIHRLDVSDLSYLYRLRCDNNNMTKLVLSNNPALAELICSYNNLTELHVSSNIRELTCFKNQLTTLDISGNNILRNLVASTSPEISEGEVVYTKVIKYVDDPYLAVDENVKLITEVTSSSGNASAVTIPDFAPTGTSGEQIYGFVNRLYTKVLGRDPETDGARYWATELYNFHQTGAQVAQGFIFSQEFKDRNTSNEEFVTILYNTFFGRDPETDGFNYWVGLLNSGNASREGVANGFIFSQEWADTCATYGIRSGGDIKPSGSIEPTDLTYAFVERMYTKAFKRDYDEGGRNYWASELANYNCTGEAVGVFFFISKEMNDYNLSNEEFINRLYLTFMDREGEADGKNYWIGVLNGGATRESVVYGFSRSPEFAERCITARIIPF